MPVSAIICLLSISSLTNSQPKDRSGVLMEVESAFSTNALKAEGTYLNKQVTFWTYVTSVARQNNAIVLKAAIVYNNGNGPLVMTDIVLTPTMKQIAQNLEPEDVVQITATLKRREVKSKDEVVISGYTSATFGGSVSGGTVTRQWPVYTFVGGTVKVISTSKERKKAAQQAATKAEQERTAAENARKETYRKAYQDFDLESAKKVLEWNGYDYHTVTSIGKACIEADPKSPTYDRVRQVYRLAVSTPNYLTYAIARPTVEARRVLLLKDLLDCEKFNVFNGLDMPLTDAYLAYRRSAQTPKEAGPERDSFRGITLDATDIEVFRVIADHPRCKGLPDYRRYSMSFREEVWSDYGWVKNKYLDQLREIFPKQP